MSYERDYDKIQYNAFYTPQDLSDSFWRGLMTGIGLSAVAVAAGVVLFW